MMTNKILPKLWLYIALAITLSLLLLCACSQDKEAVSGDGDTTTTQDQSNQINEYTITYSPGSFAEGAKKGVVKKLGESVILEADLYQRVGFTLVGWQEKEGDAQFYPVGYEFTEDRTLTLYPVWAIKEYEVVLSPGANGQGNPVVCIKKHASSFTLPAHVFEREGYTQIGWAIVDGGEQVLALGAEYQDDRAITLYPVWQKNHYSVSFAPGKEIEGQIFVKNVLYGESLTLPGELFERENYDLVGWSTEDGGAITYTPTQELVVKNNITLYPVWELTKTYDITPDYKKLPQTLMTTMNVADLALYYKLVNAFFNYETSVSFTSDTNPELVLEILHCYFPVMYAGIDDGGPWIDTQNSTINFSYVTASSERHNEKIEEFTKVLTHLLSDFNRTDTDVERALLIYQRLMQRVEYDNEFDLHPFDVYMVNKSGYYAIVYGKGMGETFSNAYAFLLTQADVDAVVVSSNHKTDATEHYWVALMLDFKWYYADLTLDLDNQEFTHFGITDAEMITLGYENAENNAITAYTGKGIKELVDTLDTRFHVFHSGAYSPIIDRDNDKVVFKDSNAAEVVFNIIESIS